MREIKFRAWDEIEKKMFEPSSISWKDGYLWVCDSHGQNKLEYEMINPNAKLMQYTGLKDKQKKEIYEGDIVRILYTDWPSQSSSDPRPFDEYLKSLSYTGFVEYGKCEFSLNFPGALGKRSAYGDLIPGAHGFMEVVGNIYENPELLKEP